MILLEKIVLSKLIELGVVIVSWEEIKVLKPAEDVKHRHEVEILV